MKKSIVARARTFCSVLALTAGLGLGLTACYPDVGDMRLETAKRIATPSFMLNRNIPAGKYLLTAYERVYREGQPATIYIEGDGVAWVSKSTPSLNPTPRNPVALHLASRDNGANVIYLARPCQFTGLLSDESCKDREDWTGNRFSPEIIAAMSAALDNIAAKYDIPAFNLVGFSGGGAVAALLAAERDDVASLRTVAGNLDHATLNAMHEVSPMPGSLNPVDIAPMIANIPQHHFIGEWDEVVTPAIYDSFREAAGPTTCMRSSIVKEVDHEDGWVNIWPTLLKAPLDCDKH